MLKKQICDRCNSCEDARNDLEEGKQYRLSSSNDVEALARRWRDIKKDKGDKRSVSMNLITVAMVALILELAFFIFGQPCPGLIALAASLGLGVAAFVFDRKEKRGATSPGTFESLRGALIELFKQFSLNSSEKDIVFVKKKLSERPTRSSEKLTLNKLFTVATSIGAAVVAIFAFAGIKIEGMTVNISEGVVIASMITLAIIIGLIVAWCTVQIIQDHKTPEEILLEDIEFLLRDVNVEPRSDEDSASKE